MEQQKQQGLLYTWIPYSIYAHSNTNNLNISTDANILSATTLENIPLPIATVANADW